MSKMLIIISVIFLCSCMFTTKEVPDKNSCVLETKKRTLDYKVINGITINNCTNDNCPAKNDIGLIIMAMIPVGSALVSGSIVVVGNTVHWMEYQGRCPESFLNKAKQAFVDLYK